MTGAAVVLALAMAWQRPPVFAAKVESVYVDVFVTRGGVPVTGLGAADFVLRDNGVAQEVELVNVATLPVRTLLVFDTSGSVAGAKLERLREAGRLVVRGLRPGDEAGLVGFSEDVALLAAPTADTAAIERALTRMNAAGGTALHDALYAGIKLGSGSGRSLLVLFTDGMDNVSWLDFAAVRSVAEESNVLVQAVGIVPEAPASFATRGVRVELDHVRGLRQLAEATGGRFWSASAPARLRDAFQSILEAMKLRYVLRFEPRGVKREGRHTLEVRLSRRSADLHARSGYFVGAGAGR